ncbi:DUF397 domain-containing protein [Streptosporangium sp. NPDC023963]|uniref:DUF397 domain-containing protein n=1 Tax=Streptosporangium sp. NPDC023963 TaxID=3155608 RepID=UPI00342661AE
MNGEYSGIDPERMNDFERGLGRAPDTLGRNEPQIRRTLQRFDLDASGLGALREMRSWIKTAAPTCDVATRRSVPTYGRRPRGRIRPRCARGEPVRLVLHLGHSQLSWGGFNQIFHRDNRSRPSRNPRPSSSRFRDSRDPAGPAPTFSPTAWNNFLTGLRTGEI